MEGDYPSIKAPVIIPDLQTFECVQVPALLKKMSTADVTFTVEHSETEGTKMLTVSRQSLVCQPLRLARQDVILKALREGHA